MMTKILGLAVVMVTLSGTASAGGFDGGRGGSGGPSGWGGGQGNGPSVGGGHAMAAPEIDPASAMSALTMLGTGLVILKGRRSSKK